METIERIVKRDGRVVDFDIDKITDAIFKAAQVLGGKDTPRNTAEAITREQSLRALTINVARQWHQEHRMGSIEFGKIANMTVFDCDFLHDDIEKVGKANIIATIVDGEEVYKA